MSKRFIKTFAISYILIMSMNINADYIQLSTADVLKIPLPLPYNGIVYEKSSIEDFISSAVKADKQPVLIFGGNWCPDCRILSGSLKMPTMKKYMSRNFDVMHIDVGRYEINMDLLEMFGIEKEKGVPRVLVFDKKKNLINSSTTKEWTTVRERKQQEIFNYFQDLTL
tara:strand:+ start:336 stop:839 length:504 start_codon:yes stop_codon:yes gene_type:complete